MSRPKSAEISIQAARTQAVETAAEQVRTERSTLQAWEDRLAVSEVEFAEAEASSGTRALDDPEGGTEIARELGALRETVAVQERAIVAQQPRVVAAERVYCGAEADLLDVDLTDARETLAGHEAKVGKLLAQLEELEGEFVPLSKLRAAQRLAGVEWDDGPLTWKMPASAPKRDRVALLERQVAVLRAMEAGEDPAQLVESWGDHISAIPVEEAYPACVWGPDALVPAPRFVAQVEQQRARVADIEATIDELRAEDQELDDRRPTVSGWEVGLFDTRVRHVNQRLEDLPGELEVARADLKAIGG